jgi:hypothetical protein
LSDDEKSAGIECLVANEMIGLAKELQVDDRVQLLNYHMGHRGRSKKICSLKEMRRFNDLTLPLNAIRHAVNEDLLRPVEGKLHYQILSTIPSLSSFSREVRQRHTSLRKISLPKLVEPSFCATLVPTGFFHYRTFVPIFREVFLLSDHWQ